MTHDPSLRLQRLEQAIADQRVFLHRIPDPDTRERAEEHLLVLVRMRDEVLGAGTGQDAVAQA